VGVEMDQDLEFTRHASLTIQGILKPMLDEVAQFDFMRNDKIGTFVRVTIDELVKIDVYFEPTEGWRVALYKLTKKSEINKTFGYHQELLVKKIKNVANGHVVITSLLPVLEKYLSSSPLNKHLTSEQTRVIQVRIDDYKQKKLEAKIRESINNGHRPEATVREPKSTENTTQPRTREPVKREVPANKNGVNPAVIWVIVGLIVAAILGASGSGGDDCDFYPDPRGGFTDCS